LRKALQEIETPFLFAGRLARCEGTVQLGMSHVVLVEILCDANDVSLTVTSYYAPGTYYSLWAQYSGDTNNLSTQTAGTIQEVFTGTTLATFVGQTGGLSHQGRVTINLQ